MFKIKKYIPDIVVAIILIAGIGLLAYPTIGDYINALHSSKAIGSYVEKTKDLSKEEKENLLREAENVILYIINLLRFLFIGSGEFLWLLPATVLA